MGDDRRAWRGLSIALSQRLAEGWQPGELARILVAEYTLPGRIRTSVERLLCARASRLEGPAPSAVAAAQVEATSRMLDARPDRPALPDVETFDELDEMVRTELLEDAAGQVGDPPSRLPRDLATHRRLVGAVARDKARRRGYVGSGGTGNSAQRGSERVPPGRETPHMLTTRSDASTGGDRDDGENTLARATRTVRCSHCGATRKTRAYGGIPLRCGDDECGRYFKCPAPGADGEVSVDPPDDDGDGGEGKPSGPSNGKVRRAKRARTSRSSGSSSDDGGSSSGRRRGVLPWQR